MSETNQRLPPMSWWKWTHDTPETNPIFVRAIIVGVNGGRGSREEIRALVDQDSLSARQFYGEIAFRIGSLNGLTVGMRDFLAECFERISHGEDCRDVLGLRRCKGDKRTPQEQIWACHCVVETLCFGYGLSENQAFCLLGSYFNKSESTYRKLKDHQYASVARTMLQQGDVIATGPGLEDLVNLIPYLFPNHEG
ncbi:hypothetical protein HW932_19170 [Allochromatium humboldtianum]|uniref:Uncharacterized protein n=1 Tax=Allochromatium humboldtianum TaxID=504901 RepID=A0A850REH2_9GAMM|nr:hypothetical protein [Allochromatium humboldtianum]NVZ11375.1 hypothetical protein [Allochromatium humboldtianum]